MSIEKIKERIRMIESNDFNTNNADLNEYLVGKKEDWDQIMKTNDPKLYMHLARSASNSSEIQDAANELLGNKSRIKFLGGDLNSDTKRRIDGVFNLLKKHNVLSNDIDPKSFESKNGWGKDGTGKILTLEPSKNIELEFMSNNNNILRRIIIKKDSSFNDNDFNNFLNEAKAKAVSLNISKIFMAKDSKGIDYIQINFTR